MKPPPDEKTAVTEKKKPDDERVVTTTTTVSTPPRKRLWTWIIAGVGGAALATGATFGYLASEAKSDFDKEPWADKAEDLKKTVESRALTANILFGVGGAAMATALVLYFLEGSAEQLNTDNASALEISPTPLGIKALIRF